jgi:hypothetical protein
MVHGMKRNEQTTATDPRSNHEKVSDIVADLFRTWDKEQMRLARELADVLKDEPSRAFIETMNRIQDLAHMSYRSAFANRVRLAADRMGGNQFLMTALKIETAKTESRIIEGNAAGGAIGNLWELAKNQERHTSAVMILRQMRDFIRASEA